jgi:hypothetical protein
MIIALVARVIALDAPSTSPVIGPTSKSLGTP